MEPASLRVLCKFSEIRGIFGKLPVKFARGNYAATAAGCLRRCESTTPQVRVNVDQPLSENDHVNPLFENRNPRSLEMMAIARKPKGWKLDHPTRNYYHKLFLEFSARHTTARVEHFTGPTVVSASTSEPSIVKHLYSSKDTSAAENIGRVIAQRCLESGIIWVHVHFSQEELQSDKVKAFISALESGGLRLEEPPRQYPRRPWL